MATPTTTPARRNRRVLRGIFGGLLAAAALVAFGATYLSVEWMRTVSEPLWIKVLFAIAALAFLEEWVPRIPKTYEQVRREVTETPVVEPPVLRCARCKGSYPSRYYFPTDSDVCSQCEQSGDRSASGAS